MNEKKLLIVIWAIAVGLGLLFAHAVYAEPAYKVEGDVVTMSTAAFQKLADTLESQQALLNRANSIIMDLKDKYTAVETCVRTAAASGNATTPCFNVDPTTAGSPIEHQRFLKNTTEY